MLDIEYEVTQSLDEIRPFVHDTVVESVSATGARMRVETTDGLVLQIRLDERGYRVR